MSAQSQIFNPTLKTSQASGEGFACPTMNTASRLAIVFGASDRGMMVYDTTLSIVMFWNGAVWVPLGAGLVPVGASLNTQVIYNNAGVLEGDAGLVYNNTTDALTVAGSLLIALPTALTNGILQVAGSIGLSGNTQIRQATNADGNTLKVFATQFVAGQINSQSYLYTGNALLASIASADGVLIADMGRVTAISGRVKILNTATENVALSVEKNGIYTLYAETNTGDVTVGIGNVVVGTSGKGIDFSATAGIGTSELLDDYEEGTWTPTDASGAGLAITGSGCVYTKIGRVVTIEGLIIFPANASAATAAITGLPFNNVNILGLNPQYGSETTLAFLYGGPTSTIALYTIAQTLITNATMSNDSFFLSGTYTAAT